MYQVKKRNGQVVPFDLTKISGAIRAAFDAKTPPTTMTSSTCCRLKLRRISVKKS